MPETPTAAMDVDTVSREWLQGQLRAATDNVIVLDCRSTNEFAEGHIRLALNFSIPSIMLRRLAAGKIALTSTIKCRELKRRIENAYRDSVFVLYTAESVNGSVGRQQQQQQQMEGTTAGAAASSPNAASGGGGGSAVLGISVGGGTSNGSIGADATIINVLHRRLKQDGCRVYLLEDGFTSFRDAFPEWCEDDASNTNAKASLMGTGGPTEQLMGLRSLRISTPHSDSACSSSGGESSDCESTTIRQQQQQHHHQQQQQQQHQQQQQQQHANNAHQSNHHHHHHHHHPPLADAPVEIVAGLYLGNAAHSRDAASLQRYNIRFVLNVTPDLENVFQDCGAGIEYLQIPITDHWSQDLAGYFPTAIKFIEDARNSGCSVLVHCLAGVSRSVTVTLAYLMHSRSLCLNDAFSLVRQRKPDVSPNFHFMEQLHTFEGQLLKQNPVRTPLSALSACSVASSEADSSSASGSYMTPDCASSAAATPDIFMSACGGVDGSMSGGMAQQQRMFGRPSKYSCACLEVECKCMMMTPALVASVVRLSGSGGGNGGAGGASGSGSSGGSSGGGVGVSPDSGIEFDRWTPGTDGTPK